MMRRMNDALLTVPGAREKGIAWCNEHGIDPTKVPLIALIDDLGDNHYEIEVYDTTASGLPQWDEERQQPKMRWLHVKANRPFPEELLED